MTYHSVRRPDRTYVYIQETELPLSNISYYAHISTYISDRASLYTAIVPSPTDEPHSMPVDVDGRVEMACVSWRQGMVFYRLVPPEELDGTVYLHITPSDNNKIDVYLRAGEVPTNKHFDHAVTLVEQNITETIPLEHLAGDVPIYVGLEDVDQTTLATKVWIKFSRTPPPPPPAKTYGGLPIWGVVLLGILALAIVVVFVAWASTFKRLRTAQDQARRGVMVVDGVEMDRVKYGQLGDDKAMPAAPQPAAEDTAAQPESDEARARRLLRELAQLPAEVVQAAQDTRGVDV